MRLFGPRIEVFSALDIGTSKVAAFVARIDDEDWVELLGVGVVKSEGVRTGAVNNVRKAADCIREAIAEAEMSSGVTIQSVATGIAGREMQSRAVETELVLGEKSREIGQKDLIRLTQRIEGSSVSDEEVLLHVEPQQYIIDGRTSTIDPVGMWGNRLALHALVVNASKSVVNNLRRCVKMGGADVGDLVLEPLASADAVLDEDERFLGTGLLDMGGGTSDVALFQRGSIRSSAVIPLGGDLVTRDLAVVLRAPMRAAEELKQAVGLKGVLDQENETIRLDAVGDAEFRDVPSSLVSEIIKARMQEILESAAKVFAEKSFREPLAGGVVLTGGTSKMKGLEDLASNILKMPVRCGSAKDVRGDDAVITCPEHATGMGLLIRVADRMQRDGELAQDRRGLLKWIKDAWKELG